MRSPTWLSSKAGLSGSESLLPPLLLPRDTGLLWEGEPASEGGGLSVSTTSGFMPSTGTSEFPPLPQADTRSFRDSTGGKGAGLREKARDPHPTQINLGPWGRGLGVGLASEGQFRKKEVLRALVGSELKVSAGRGRARTTGHGRPGLTAFVGSSAQTQVLLLEFLVVLL